MGRYRPGRRHTLSVVAGIGVLVLVACGGGGAGTTGGNYVASSYHPKAGTQGGQLVYSDWESVDDLNSIGNTAQTVQQVAEVVWAGLWEVDGTNAYLPDLAAAIPTTGNGMVKLVDSTHMDVTVKLKKGLAWSDGQPLTTADVKFSWQAVCDPTTGAVSQVGWDHVSDMEIKDDQTMVWHFGPDPTGKRCGLAAPLTSGIYAPYLLLGASSFGNGPYPQHVLQSVAHKDWPTAPYFTQKPTATSGPYIVDSFTPGPAAEVVLKPNPHYKDGRNGSDLFFGHAPYLDTLIYKIYGDKSSQIAGLKAGDTDLGLDLIAKDLPALQTITQDTTLHQTGLQDEFVNFNTGNNKTGCDAQQFADTCGTPTVLKGDTALRQALDLAIDKNQMNQSLVGGIGKPMNSLLVSSMTPYYDASTPAFQRDVTKANSMLDADGWAKGADGIRVKNGRKLVFVLSTTAGNPQRAAEEEQLIANWKDIGASVSTKNWPAGKFFNSFTAGGILATGQFDVAMFANTWSPDPDAWCAVLESNQIPSAANPSGSNYTFTKDPTLDSLCQQGASEIDVSKRVSIYKQVEQEFKKEQPMANLYERPNVYTLNPAFSNFLPSANTCISVCNAADWFHGKS